MADFSEILKTVQLLTQQNEQMLKNVLTPEVQSQMSKEELEFIEQTKSAFKINGGSVAEKMKDLSNLIERHGSIINARKV